MSFAIVGLIALGAVMVARADRSAGGVDRPAPQVASAPQAAPVPASKAAADAAAGFTYRVPKPGDKEYADYQEMLRVPAYASTGAPMPYDPEWRSFVSGRRDVPLHDRALTQGGAPSLDDLCEQFVFAVRNADEGLLAELRVTRGDFTDILWPEFPQSRPYVHIPVDEAWLFQGAKLHEGSVAAVVAARERPLVLEAVRTIRVREFTNFRILEVRVFARDEKTGESLELTGEKGATVIERQGRFKFYLYQN